MEIKTLRVLNIGNLKTQALLEKGIEKWWIGDT